MSQVTHNVKIVLFTEILVHRRQAPWHQCIDSQYKYCIIQYDISLSSSRQQKKWPDQLKGPQHQVQLPTGLPELQLGYSPPLNQADLHPDTPQYALNMAFVKQSTSQTKASIGLMRYTSWCIEITFPPSKKRNLQRQLKCLVSRNTCIVICIYAEGCEVLGNDPQFEST